MDKITLRQRWQRALKDTKGFRAWKRELFGAALVAVIAYGALNFHGSQQGAVEEVIAIGSSVLATLILIPVVEFTLNFIKAPIRITWAKVGQLDEQNQKLRLENQTLLESLAAGFDITLGDIEANFDEGASPLRDLFEDHQVRSGKRKRERRHKLVVHNLSKGRSIKNVHVDLIDIEVMELDEEYVPAYLNGKTPLQLLKTQLPLRLCFSNHRNPPYSQSIELDPRDKADVDVVRWEFDGQNVPTFFLCHIREGVSGEIPLGKYKLTVQVAGEDAPAVPKTLVLDKLEDKSIEKWGLKEGDS